MYANEIVYPLIIAANKCSILALYIRIFGIDNDFSKATYVMISLTVAWMLAALFGAMFQCQPIHAVWDQVPDKKCLDLGKYLLFTNITNILIDFGILAMPIPRIWKLNLSKKQKIAISCVFLLGTL